MKSKGFTLVELLIVIVLIGVLATIFFAINPLNQFKKANDTRRKSDLAQIQRALQAYYQDNGAYPASTDVTDDAPFRMKSTSGTAIEWGSQDFDPYMPILPKDKNDKKKYAYYSSGQAYYLYADLDLDTDSQRCTGVCTSLSLIPSSACDKNGGGDYICDYVVTSSNVSP